MTPADIDRVFGRGRLKMATGEHVEVFREAVGPGERRRYTKRFLSTREGDFGQWTEREWRILARLIGHGIGCVPDVVQFDRGAPGGARIVQTYDAGATVDQWATILPVSRNGRVYRHVFEDCAHWWALAHHALSALQAIHELSLVHLDVKGDNVCIPVGPADFDADARDARMRPLFGQLALIDFAFSLVSREALTTPLPIGWQKHYDYQSPRLLRALEAGRNGDLQPTRDLDWRCDMYSVAAMLKRYLPDDDVAHARDAAAGWTADRYHAAKALILAIREAHDGELPSRRPHDDLLEMTRGQLAHTDMIASLEQGWTLARDASIQTVAALPLTPLTCLAPSVRVTKPPVPVPVSFSPIIVSPRAPLGPPRASSGAPRVIRRRTPVTALTGPAQQPVVAASPAAPAWLTAVLLALIGMGFVIALGPQLRDRLPTLADDARAKAAALRAALNGWRQAPAPAVREESPALPREAAAAAAPDEPRASEEATVQSPPPAAAPASAAAEVPTPPAEQRTVEHPGSATAPNTGATRAMVAVPLHRVPSRSAAASRKTTTAASNAPVPLSNDVGTKTRTARVANERASQPSVKVSTRHAGSTSPLRASSTPAHTPVEGAHSPAPALPPRETPQIAALSASQAPERATATTSASGNAVRDAVDTAPHVGTEAAPRTTDASAAPANPASPRHAETPRVQSAERPGLLTRLFGFAKRGGKAAPIEERMAQAVSPEPRAPRTAPADAKRTQVATIGERPYRPATTASSPSRPDAASASSAGAPVAAAPSAAATVAPLATAPVPPPVAPLVAAPVPPTVAPLAAAPQIAQPPPSVHAAPAFEEASSAPNASVSVIPDIVEPDPAASRPTPRANYRGDYFGAQARRVLSDSVPLTAASAEPEVARMLASAAIPYHPGRQIAIVGEARRTWKNNVVTVAAVRAAPDVARQLKNEARRAFIMRRSVDEMLDLQLEAFGANPFDAEVAGDLGALYLKAHPAQPRIARQLAMHAMALTSAQFLAPRVQDWTTFAVSSALMGREQDAVNGLFVAAAIGNNLGATCRAALAAAATHGDRMHAPVEALMQRIHEEGRDYESRYCAWPPRWSTASGFF